MEYPNDNSQIHGLDSYVIEANITPPSAQLLINHSRGLFLHFSKLLIIVFNKI